MKKHFNKLNPYALFFLIIIALSIFLRFYNLNWGAPYYFHPDERNIASSISGLRFPESMNPNFFAYGSLPIYSAYFLGLISNYILKFTTQSSDIILVNFTQSIIILRSLSLLLSILVTYLVYNLIKKSTDTKYAILGASLTGLNVGLIQYSHFGTFEIWLTAFFLLLSKFIYEYLNSRKNIWLLLSSLSLGALLSIKVSSVVILPIIFLTIVVTNFKTKKDFKKISKYANTTARIILVTLVVSSIFVITSPFAILDFKSFIGSMNYESSVALGTINVFYTGGFIDTIPIIYQLFYVYPYILNPVNLIVLLTISPFILLNLKKYKNTLLPLSIAFFLFIFLSQSFLYVKWIRYYIPTIPFLIIILTFGIKILIENFSSKYQKVIFYSISSLLILSSAIFSFSYFKTVFYKPDTRIAASEFANLNIPSNAKIVSEVYDLGIIPFNDTFPNITLFNFYEIDSEYDSQIKIEELRNLISISDYLILSSQRIIRNRMLNKNAFPNGYEFYNTLDQRYELIYETPCDIFCKILYIGDPIFATEETANVFDRPIIQIYKINHE